MTKTGKIVVQDTPIRVILGLQGKDYISLTDMAHFRDNDPFMVIGHWMRDLNTIEYLGLWETINNPDFNPTEFGRFRTEAGYNAFTMSPKKWIESTNAIGIISKSGRYGGTFAHRDIAFNFGMWLNSAFQLYVVKEFERLKEQESNPLLQQWDIKRILRQSR